MRKDGSRKIAKKIDRWLKKDCKEVELAFLEPYRVIDQSIAFLDE